MSPMPVEPPAPVAAADPPPVPEPEPEPADDDIDMNSMLSDVGDERSQPPAIESVLKGMRDDAAHEDSPETAEQHFKLAASYSDMGMRDEAMKALEVAARSPRHRFRAGAMLAKVYLDSGDRLQAIEWYERAVEAPAPTPAAHHALLYELATVLEAHGENARALGVLLELQSDAGEYRDVSKRLEQLKVQMGS